MAISEATRVADGVTRFDEDRYCRIGSILARSGAQHRT
jgi:hypothetical protein